MISPDQPSPQANELADTFQGLIEQARAGSADACQRLYDRYHEHVLRVVRRHLHTRLRSILDSTDVTQDIWKSVFACIQGGQPFAGPREFLAFLTSIAHNKTLLQYRQAIETDKRSLCHEEPLAAHAGELREYPDPTASPADVAATEDEWAQLLGRLPERARLALEGLRAGDSLEELAQRLGVSVKTLRREAQHYLKDRFQADDERAG